MLFLVQIYPCPILEEADICNQADSSKQVLNLWLVQMTHCVLKYKWSANQHQKLLVLDLKRINK